MRIFTSFFFNDTATTEIYTLSLHDALPILATANERLGERVEPQRMVEILYRFARVDAIALVGSRHEAAELVAIGDAVVALQPEVATDAGVLDADQIAHVIDVIDHIVHGRRLLRVDHEADEIDADDAAGLRQRANRFVGHAPRVAGMQRPAVAVRDDDRLGRGRTGIENRAVAAMRQVDHHADLIHALDDADAELGEAGVGRLEGTAANQVPEVVRQLRFALTQSVEHIDIVRRAEML